MKGMSLSPQECRTTGESALIIDPNKKVNKIKQQPKAGKFIEYGYVWLTI